MIDRRIVFASFVAGVLIGWYMIQPAGPPAPDRPVIKWLAKAAKNLLWIAVFIEPPPPEVPDDLPRARVGADGFKMVEHKRGW
jgi:hypothetical protein